MALDPLKFQVAIQDEATGQLNKIEQEFNKLKDKTISVKVEGLQDLQNLLSALQHKQVETLGKDVAAGIHDAAKGLQEEAQKAVRASLGQLAQDLVAVKTAIQHDNFTAFSTRIEKCAQAVNTLDAAFKQFQVTIGADAGMKNFMTGLGEVIRNVRTTMGTLEVSKGGGGALSSLANTYARNVERMEDALFRLQEARAKVSNAIKSAEGAGMDNNIISRWRIYLQVLDAYEKKLQNIKNNDALMNGRGWQTNAFGTTFKHLLSNASDFEKAANVFISAQEKLSAAREKATGMNAGAAAQRGVSLISGQSTQEIRKQIDAIGALYMRIQELSNLTHSRSSFNKQLSFNWDTSKIPEKDLLEVYSQTFSKLRAELKTLKESGYDVSGFKSQLDSLYATYEKFAALQPVDLGNKLGLEHVKGYTGPSSAATDTQWAAMKHQAEVQEVAGEAAKRHQRKLEELTNAFAQHDAQVAKSQRVQEGDNKARQESAAALRKQAQELVKARMEILRTQSADLGKLLSMGRGALGSEQYDAVRNALRGVREEMRQIEGVMQRMDSYSTRSLFSIGRGTTPDYFPLVSSTKKLIAAKEQAAQASNQMTAAEQQLAQALNQTTESAKGQSQVLSDLKSMATQYLGVWGGQQFLHNIIEIGGQLEMQRLSIGAILQNTAQANELFDKIKHLATQSPFGVVQLDQMTKQLTAYGFKYNELYDMTKRLADISAATGTDVSRLALALGHVRSEAALSGYTLRQFSMANVPLLQKLAEKFGVTTSQVRKMVSRKEIGYDDVLNVLKDLTNQGGPFYEAQETMSEALNAKFKNLRDSYEIMFNEIAESKVGGGLKDLAVILTDVSRHWEELFTVVGTGIAVFGGMKAYMALVNSLLGANATAVIGGIKAYQRAEIASLRLAESYRDITLAEKAMTATTHKWTMSERLAHTWIGRRLGLSRQLNDMQKLRISTTREQIVFGNALALSEKRQTTEDLARQVALGKMSKAQARQAIILSDLAKSEKTAGIAAVNSVRTYGAMTGVVNGASMAFTKLGMAMKSLFLNPQMAVFALLAGVMYLWQRNKQEIERAKELNDDLFNRAQEGIKNIRSMMETTGMKFKLNDVEVEVGDTKDILNGKFTYKPSAEMDAKDMIANIEKWTEFLKEYAAYPNRILNAAFKDDNGNVRTIAEQYDMLAKSVSETAEAYVYLKQVSSAIEFAENATNEGLLRDDFVTNIEDYSKWVKKYNDSITELTIKHAQSLETAMSAARGEKTFADALKAANAAMVKNEKRNLTQAEQLKMLVENQDKYTDAIKAFEEARESLSDFEKKSLSHVFHGAGAGWLGANGPDKFASQMNDAFAEMDADATKWANSLKAKLTEAGWDFNNLTESQKQAIALAIAETVSKAGDATEDIREKAKKLASEKFGVNIDVKTVEAAARVVALEQSLKDLVGHDWHIDIKTATNFSDVISKIRQDYKSAQDYFNNVKPLMIKMGVDVSGGMKVLGLVQRQALLDKWKKENPGKDASAMEMLLDQWDALAKGMNDALDFQKVTGIPLSDPNSGGKVLRDKHTSAKTDKELETWRKRVQLLEKYRQELAQLEKVMSRVQAEQKLKSDGNFAPLWGYFSNPNDFNASLDEVARRLGTKGDRKSFVDELGAKKSTEELRLFKENISNAVSELDRLADIMGENYETYKKWLDLTGDSDLAARIAGVAQNSSMAGWLTDKMDEQLRKSGDSRSASEVFGMSESDVKKFGENSAIYKLWDEWQKNNEKIKKQNLDLYAEAIKNAKGYAEKVADINRELEKEIAAIREMTGGDTPTEEQQSQRTVLIKNATDTANRKIADETWNNFKATEEWGRIFADLDRISTGTLTRMLEKLRQIAPTLNGSVESTKAVYEAIDRVQNVVNGRNPFKAIGESLSNRSALSGYYKQAKEKGNLVANAELSKLLGVKLGSTVTKDQIKDGMKNESENFQKAIGKVVDDLQRFQNGLELVSGVFDSLGMSGASNLASDASSVLGGAMQGASALSALGPWGMAAGAGLGLISGLAQVHDKRLERQIEKLREDVQKIEANTKLIQQARERTLGYDTGELRSSYAKDYAPNQTQAQRDLIAQYPWLRNSFFLQGYNSKAQKDMYEYYSQNSSGTGYQQEYQNLLQQRKDYMDILDKQESKKKKSQSDIEETKSKIAELDDQIRYFTMDLAKELWDIDIKGWADQLSDALASAFENGESMAKAYKETVTSILQQVMNKMMQMAILEPMFQSLQDKLFGNAEKNISGVFDRNDPNGSMSKVTAMITDFFGKGGEGEKTITAATEFMTAFQRGLENAGLSVLNESANALTSSVQGTSEETSDLLAGYINALRQDVAVNRILLTQFVTQLWPEYVESFANHVRTVANIDVNVQLMMEMMRDGGGAFFAELSAMRSRLDNVVDGIESLSVK